MPRLRSFPQGLGELPKAFKHSSSLSRSLPVLPLLKAKQALNRLGSGAVLKVDCTDAGSVRDFQVFAKQSGHSLIEQQEQDGHYIHWLKKA